MISWLHFFCLFSIGTCAMSCLCLTTARHSRLLILYTSLLPWRKQLRSGGWLLLLLMLLIAIAIFGWGIGLITVIGLLSFITLLVLWLITYQPQWAIYSTILSGAVGAISLAFMTTSVIN